MVLAGSEVSDGAALGRMNSGFVATVKSRHVACRFFFRIGSTTFSVVPGSTVRAGRTRAALSFAMRSISVATFSI